MQLILKQLLILYIFILAGYLIGKKFKKKAEHSEIISVLLVNLMLPCKVFRSFANNFTVPYLKEKYSFLIASTSLLLLLVLGAFFFSKLLSKQDYERRVYRYSLAITNYAYLGYVLIESVFGEKMLADFIFFAIPFIFYTYTFGYALLTGGKNPWKRLLNPITFSILLGIIVGLSGISLPSVLDSVISSASACVGPLSMLLTGITLSAFSLKGMLCERRAYVFSAIRLLAIPLLVYGVCRLLHLDAILPMMVMITCMPCGLNTIVFPKLVGEDCRLGAGLALISHFFALPCLLLWLTLIS